MAVVLIAIMISILIYYFSVGHDNDEFICDDKGNCKLSERCKRHHDELKNFKTQGGDYINHVDKFMNNCMSRTEVLSNWKQMYKEKENAHKDGVNTFSENLRMMHKHMLARISSKKMK